MSEERQIERWLELADAQRRRGDWAGAIDSLRNVLSRDPEHAVAHAQLAFTLLDARRLPGAVVEAELALAHGGGEPLCHLAAAAVACAERELDRAWDHCQVALEAEPEDVFAHVIGARIHLFRHAHGEARALLERALELEPEAVEAVILLARVELDLGQVGEAAVLADRALTLEPDHADAHIVAGTCELLRGQLGAAEEHARFALHADPTDDDAIRLWTSLKARRSWTLGVAWRFSAWIGTRSERGSIALLIGSFVLVRVAMILAAAADLEGVARVLSLAWFGFCAYTWTAPVVFRRMLERDLQRVVLRDDF